MAQKKEEKQEFVRKSINLDFAKLASLIVRDLTKANQQLNFFKKYKKEDVIKYLESPQKYEKELRNISNFIYNVSHHYRRLVNYFAKMLIISYSVQPYDINIERTNIRTFKNSYLKILNYLETMNLKHEFSKILTIAFKEDVFYGYEYMSNDSYFIQRLDPDYCQISSIEDGCYNYSFDFSYFDKYPEKLNYYDEEFKRKYNVYKNNKKDKRWQELDSNKTICIKINEDLDYVFPPFAGVFEAIFDIQDYKSLKKAKEELGNYKLLIEEIPIRKDSDTNNDFTIELDLAKAFHDKTVQSLPDQVGAILSPMKITSVDFKQDTVNSDKVIEAEKLYWSSAGVNGNLFSDNGNSGAVVNLSIKTDETIAFSVLRQLERWVNRKLKFLGGTYKFKVEFLNLTVFNQSDIIDKYLTFAQYGLPVKEKLCVAIGMSPLDMINMNWLENDVLKLTDTWKPLQSSHTQSGKENKGGRPTKNDNEIDNAGEISRSNDVNNPDNRV